MALARIQDRRVVIVGSLAKAFGAPVAVLAGPARLVAEFADRSATRMHCNPPSAAVIAAAVNALAINRSIGDALRERLAAAVSRFRRGLGALAGSPGLFPVQHLRLPLRTDSASLHGRLRDRGIQTVLSRSGDHHRARIAFVLTARHGDGEIDQALASLRALTGLTTHAHWEGGSGNGKSVECR